MQENTLVNRAIQNLSARYNYIYNANNLLNDYQLSLGEAYKDDYANLLTVYITPPPSSFNSDTSALFRATDLNNIAMKAQAIISEKNFSNYLPQAYLLLGKTEFYKGNSYTASAYFDYVKRTFQKDKNIYLDALTWKARTYLQLNNKDRAGNLLDSVNIFLDSVKHDKAESLATLAQYYMEIKAYPKAIPYLEKAIKESKTALNRIRWSYILAQLYEREQNYKESLHNYTRVSHSNALFEMYFNAQLSKIRINDLLNPHELDRKEQLLKLLKDDKNADYVDQIYFEVAEDYFADKDYQKAAGYYSLSAQKSTINQNQKGLAYLKLADLNFKELNNATQAKLYYDSAVNVLPKTYPNYEQILKKVQNLNYLTTRYQIIAHQDSLQYLASLPLATRESQIAAMFRPKPIVTGKTVNTFSQQNTQNVSPLSNRLSLGGVFYFNNQPALSRGFTDFKKRWGNRILEDNWRQSVKSSAQLNQQNLSSTLNNESNTGSLLQDTLAFKRMDEQIKAYTAQVPLNTAQKVNSDRQIINAYFEIGAFYQQVLNDQSEAIRVYEKLLARYAENEHLEAIYYSLYLAYNSVDKQKAEHYKNLVLAKYPASLYAKTILDPSFSLKQNEVELEVNKIYNEVFDNYEKKDYQAVIEQVKDTNKRFPQHPLQIQFDYLKAISIGKTENVDSLLGAFHQITTQYPTDSLITPLVKDHLAYIDAHLEIFKSRKIALIDFDPTAPQFINKPVLTAAKPALQPAIVSGKPKAAVTQVQGAPLITLPKTLPVAAKTTDSLFSLTQSDIYYFVIDINQTNLSVSSSRFGIGQFNRGNYTGRGLKHQLLDLEADQLIYIGNFDNLNEVNAYATRLIVQLPKIMKIPAGTYQSFIISKENFDKIKDRATINRYLEFYKSNFSTL